MSKEINKNLYKIFLIIVKYIPSILSMINIISLVLNYFGVPTIILSCVGGSSILFLILLWLISFVFQYCYLYKIPLAYNTSIMIVNLLKFSKVISLDIISSYRIHAILLGIFISLFVIYRYKNRHKDKSKENIDRICKFLCGD
jgi:Ca2+/Na+ antiporter